MKYLRQALRVAGELKPPERSQTTAAEVARSLAKMYAERGHPSQAQALYAQADAIETGSPAEPDNATPEQP